MQRMNLSSLYPSHPALARCLFMIASDPTTSKITSPIHKGWPEAEELPRVGMSKWPGSHWHFSWHIFTTLPSQHSISLGRKPVGLPLPQDGYKPAGGWD